MSDYTPDTDEVRGMYAVMGFSGGPRQSYMSNSLPTQPIEAWLAEFDRWLDEVKKEAKEEVLKEMDVPKTNPELVENYAKVLAKRWHLDRNYRWNNDTWEDLYPESRQRFIIDSQKELG